MKIKMKNKEDFNKKDKANILIAFYNDNGFIDKENVFFRKDIEIKETDIDNISGIFTTKEILNIKPKNCSGFIPGCGYVFEYFEHGAVAQFSESYNAMIYISKKPYEDMKKAFFNDLNDDLQTEIKKLKQELTKTKKQIKIFNELKN